MTQFESNVSGSLDIAQTLAIENKNVSLEPVHLVLGLLKNPQTQFKSPDRITVKNLEKLIKELPRFNGGNQDPRSITPSTGFSQWILSESIDHP